VHARYRTGMLVSACFLVRAAAIILSAMMDFSVYKYFQVPFYCCVCDGFFISIFFDENSFRKRGHALKKCEC
jgi:hypothetical protein